MANLVIACLLDAAQAYLICSIIFGILISKVFFHDDVRTHGSGSAGMTNMLRNYGALAGAGTAIGDVGKSFVCVWIGKLIFAKMAAESGIDPICGAYLAGIFAIIGHTKPIFFGFQGGKGVLVGGGCALATEPLVTAILFVIFMVEFAVTRIVSLGSIIIAALYPVATVVYWAMQGMDTISLLLIALCTAVMGAMVVYMHRTNIERLKNGTEYRFGSKNKKS